MIFLADDNGVGVGGGGIVISTAFGGGAVAAVFLKDRLSKAMVFADMGAKDTTPARESAEAGASKVCAVEAASSSIR